MAESNSSVFEVITGTIVTGVLFFGATAIFDTKEGYNPKAVEGCKPHHTSEQPATIEAARLLLKRNETMHGDYLDSAAQTDTVPMQQDKIDGIGEIVCRLATDGGDVIHFTKTGQAMTDDPVLKR